MSKYHRDCHIIQPAVREDIVRSITKKSFSRRNHVQTTKELYIAVPPEESPIYRHYFNTYFVNKSKLRADRESDLADQEYGKFSEDVNDDCFLTLPSRSQSFYWIPDQFSPWRWSNKPVEYNDQPKHEVLFEHPFTKRKARWPQRKSHHYYDAHRNRTAAQKPFYKIVIN